LSIQSAKARKAAMAASRAAVSSERSTGARSAARVIRLSPKSESIPRADSAASRA
jgi:hypothetical protein